MIPIRGHNRPKYRFRFFVLAEALCTAAEWL